MPSPPRPVGEYLLSRALGRTKKRDPRWDRASDLSSPDRGLCAVFFVSVLKRSILGWFSLPPADCGSAVRAAHRRRDQGQAARLFRERAARRLRYGDRPRQQGRPDLENRYCRRIPVAGRPAAQRAPRRLQSRCQRKSASIDKKDPAGSPPVRYFGERYLNTPDHWHSRRGDNRCRITIPMRPPTRKNGSRWTNRSASAWCGTITAPRVFGCRTLRCTPHCMRSSRRKSRSGDETPTERTAERLMDDGLDRHDAIGMVLAEHIYDVLKTEPLSQDPNAPYSRPSNG
jgi:hypothetical protein